MLSNKAKTEKSKAPRDPDAPKRFLSAFFLFCAKERAEVQKELPNCNGAAVTKELGKRWAVLDPEARKVFEEASKRDKERYEEEMKSYKPSEDFLKRKAEYEAKANLPTPAAVAERLTNPVEDYFTYLLLNWRQVHLANPGYSGRHTQEEVWRVWQEKERAGTSEVGEVKVKAAKDPLAPKKPPSAYFLFCSAKRAEVAKALPSLRPKEVTVELGRLWNELGEEEKAPYVAEYTKQWKEFKVKMKNYSKMDVMEEKESDDMEETGDGNVESLETDDVEVNLEVNLEAGDVEVDMEVDDVDVNMKEIVQEASDEVEEEDNDEIE